MTAGVVVVAWAWATEAWDPRPIICMVEGRMASARRRLGDRVGRHSR